MQATSISVQRLGTVLRPDQSRVLLRPFNPGDSERITGIIGRILALEEAAVGPLLDQIAAEFSTRHERIHNRFLKRFEEVRPMLPAGARPSSQRRLLIGSYFLAEYSLESAALFNPSIVPDPDQTRLPRGALRFVLSLRATGEGHVSSITFRGGVIHADNSIEVKPAIGYLVEPRQIPNPRYEKPLFARTLQELGLDSAFAGAVLERLRNPFSLGELRASLDMEAEPKGEAANGIWMLARSNHEVQFQPRQPLSERILFPSTSSQRNGIEDARYVHFRNDNGSYMYYATFTAFDGRVVMPELVETSDFLRFRFLTLNGPAARNKGMALFPRKINGRFAMISRQDNESIFLMYSDNVHFWNESIILLKPVFPWELIQLGNCGSPIETDSGWLVLSHGVGPMRKYCIGAFLLDRDDPSKVLGRLREPLLMPNSSEREGYVPNVVYTCGALLHHGRLVLPYAMSDTKATIVSLELDLVLSAFNRAASAVSC